MAIKAKEIGQISSGRVFHLVAPLHQQIEAFQNEGIPAPYLVTPEQMAEIRLAGLANSWTRTSVSPVAIKGGRTILVKDSPLMNPLLARAVVEAHRNGKYLEVPGAYEQAEAMAREQQGIEPEDRTALMLSQEGDFRITSETEEARFALGKQNKAYFGKFVPSGSIPVYNLKTDSKIGVVNYLWFSYPQDESNFYCGGRGLSGGGNAFAVLPTGEASELERRVN